MTQPAAASVTHPQSSPFWVIGHRGSPTLAPENTLASCRTAVERDGANGLEIDLCVTRDGEVVLWHDFDPANFQARLRRWGLEPDVRYRPRAPSGGPAFKPTDELELATLREHYGYVEKAGSGARADVEIPTLEAFLGWAAARRELGLVFLDVKLPEERSALLPVILQRLDRALEALRPRFRVVLETAYPGIVEELKRLAPHYDCALDVEPPAGLVCDVASASAVRAAIHHGLRVATPQKPRSVTFRPFATHRRIVEADLRRLNEHNGAGGAAPIDQLCSFTINDEVEMGTLIRLGVGAIQSDRPALLRQVALAEGRWLGDAASS